MIDQTPKPIFDDANPVLLLGVAKHVVCYGEAYPPGDLDIFRLTRNRTHFLFPATLEGLTWLLLFSTKYLRNIDPKKWRLILEDGQQSELGEITFEGPAPDALVQDDRFTILPITIGGIIKKPQRVFLVSDYDGERHILGDVNFSYVRLPPLSPDQIKAQLSNPLSNKAVQITIGCQSCSSIFQTYAALERSQKLESEGYTHQHDLPDQYECQCRELKFDLCYMRESLHGLLFAEFGRDETASSYIRQYSHDRVRNVADEFLKLVRTTELEAPVQSFIEANPMLLAQFKVVRVFTKPNVLGKHFGDFAVLDSSKTLWLIELESPSMQLFRKDGHPTSKLLHAYGQVVDWLNEASKHRAAFLDGLGLALGEVVAFRGVVVAGRSASVKHDVMQRHKSNSPYDSIEFLTCDELATSLLHISLKIT